MPFIEAGLRIVALDSLSGDILWSFEPMLPSSSPSASSSFPSSPSVKNDQQEVVWARLVPSQLGDRETRSLVVALVDRSTKVSSLLTWDVELNGQPIGSHHSSGRSGESSQSGASSSSAAASYQQGSPTQSFDVHGVDMSQTTLHSVTTWGAFSYLLVRV